MSNKVRRRLKKDALKRGRKLARKLATYSLAAGASLFAAGAAEATPVNDFTGAFAPGNWSVFLDPPPYAQAGAVDRTVQFLNSDTEMKVFTNMPNESNPFYYYMMPNGWRGGSEILAPSNGTISFDFVHTTNGLTGIDRSFVNPNTAAPDDNLTFASGLATGSRADLAVVGGEPIQFGIDDWYGDYFVGIGWGASADAQLLIYNFVFESAGPPISEPGALSLLALGAAGMVGRRRRS